MLPEIPVSSPAPSQIASEVGPVAVAVEIQNDDIGSYIDALLDEVERGEHRDEQVKSSLASHIRKCWQSAQSVKQEHEDRMLRNLRQRNGEYEANVLAEIRRFGGSEIFMRLTETKCRAAKAWLQDVMSVDRPWDLSPTPLADIDPDMKAELSAMARMAVSQQAQAAIAMGAVVDLGQVRMAMREMQEQAEEQVKKKIQEEAESRAGKMEKKIEDQFSEGGWNTAFAEALDDLITFGTGILKAPVARSRKKLAWVESMTGWEPKVEDGIAPEVERVSPLDIYPSEDATAGIDSCAYIIEKYRASRSNLAMMRDVDGFDADAIDRVLEQHGRGGLREWTAIDSERDDAEGRGQTLTKDGETIDCLIYHGSVQGKMLVEWGVEDIADEMDDYPVECWLVGQEVIKAAVNNDPLAERPYAKACYSSSPGSFWGDGLPELMSDVQRQANAAARALANNMSMASGPQVAVAIDKLPPGEDGTRMWPWKVWPFESSMLAGTGVPIQFFQPEMKAAELMNIYTEFSRIADDVTGIPAYIAGDQGARGAGRTASGLSMLMGAAGKTIKSIMAGIDAGLISPVVEKFFKYNMLFDPDQSIKGDCSVQAKGATALMVREQAQIRRTEFLQTTNNPVDLQIMGLDRRAELLRSVAESLSIDPDMIAPPKEEVEARVADAQAQQAAQQQMVPLQPDGSPMGGREANTVSPRGP